MASQIVAKNTFLFSTSGTPDAGDVITTNDNVFVNPKPKSVSYKDVGNGQIGNEKTKTIGDYVTAEFEVNVNVKPSGTKGNAPSYGELFKVCGLTETIVADESVTYAIGDRVPGAAKAYMDDTVRNIVGIAGDFTLGGNIGELATFKFSLKGFTDLEETSESNPAVTIDQSTNLSIESITAITVGGATVNMQSFEFATGNQTDSIYSVGRKEFYIYDLKPTVKVTAIKTKGNGTYWADLKNNTLKEIKVVLGSGDGGTVTFTASYCNPADISDSDSSGKVVYNNTWVCQSNNGGDNFSLVYT